jgi:VWFA-related protein
MFRPLNRVAVSTLAVAWLCIPAAAQTSSGPNEAGSLTPATASAADSESAKVSFTVVARSKKNQPVLDLTPADLAASDSGNPIQLSDLHLVASPLGAGTTISFLFDRLSPESAKAALSIEAKLLPMLPERTSCAVFSLDRGLRLYQNFTLDRLAIASAATLAVDPSGQQQLSDAETQLISIAQRGVFPSGSNASIEDRARARAILSGLEESQTIVRDQQAPVALAGLQALAKAEQNLPGRKVFVFVSEGISDNSKTRSMVQEVVEAANHAGIGIYTIDTNGIRARTFDVLTMMYAPPQATPIRNTPGVTSILPGERALRIGQMADANPDAYSPSAAASAQHKRDLSALSVLANDTGGFPINSGDDLREPLQRFVKDVENYYEASYTPMVKQYDGQFHPIEIKAIRNGVTIASHPGYYALRSGAAGSFGVRPFEAPLLKILGDTQLPSDVGFRQGLFRLGGNDTQREDELVVDVPVANLDVHQDRSTLLYSTHASILAQIRDKSGIVVERFSEDFSRSGALESLDTARSEVFTLQRHFTAPPGDYELETAVVDRLGGKAGAKHTAFTVAIPGDGPWLSDVALVRGAAPLGDSPDPLEPMQYAKARVVPDLSYQIPSGTHSVRFFFSVRPDVRMTSRKGKLDVDVQQDGKSVLHSSMDIVPSVGAEAVHNLVKIESISLAAGSYYALFTYSQGDETTTRDLAFTVSGDRSADAPPDDPADDAGNDGSGDSSVVTASLPAGLTELAPGRFAPAPAETSHHPAEAYLNSLLASAQQRALDYVQALVNFECLEITDRYMVPKGAQTWSRHDKIAELVSFENQEESRRVLEVDGKSAGATSYDLQGARLEGEFGGVLKIVFDPASRAIFKWKETDSIDGSPVEVFSYRIEAANSRFSVTPLPASPTIVAFHGLVYIDATTRGVRRVSMEAEGIPKTAPVRASAVTVDYDYFEINDHDYLMPVRGELRMKLHNQKGILHRIEFRDYHRFGSQTRILGVTQ